MAKGTRAAIVGIGATEFSKNSGRSELRLALEAVTAALADASVSPRDVDGLVTFAIDNNEVQAVSRNLGLEELTFFALTANGGGGGPGTVALAAMALATGKATTVVCYRAMNERSQLRFGRPTAYEGGPANSHTVDRSWTAPFGLTTPASYMAQSAQRYLHQYGASSEDFGRVAVVQRKYANSNANAFFRDVPLTLTDHQTSRMISDPLRLFDCCQESDGAVAVVLTTSDRAKNLAHPAVHVVASAMGLGPQQHGMASVYRDNIADAPETRIVGRQLWAQSGLQPTDMDVANIYDHFSCAVLMQLEALGFCGLGEAPQLIRDGGLEIGGLIPTNTNGGQLSEAYMHGFNGITEAVRQLRGTAANQVPNARLALVTGGSHVPTSGMVLGCD
jgi:acetyl-CoA acetyltransferase